MYGFTGQNQYGGYSSPFAAAPATATAVYNPIQTQQTPQNLGAVGASNPANVFTSFSNSAVAVAAAPSASPYTQYTGQNAAAAYTQYGQTAAAVAAVHQQQVQQQKLGFSGAPTAVPAPAASVYAAYANPTAAALAAQYGQTVAAVAAVQQQQQQQIQAAASGVINASAGFGHSSSTRITDSYSTISSLQSSGSYTPLSEFTNSLNRGASSVNSVNNSNSFVGITRLVGTNSSSVSANTSSGTPSTYANYDAAVYAAANSYLHSKAHGTANVWVSSAKKMGSFNSTSCSNVSVTGSLRGQNNRGRGTFPFKRSGIGQSRTTVDNQQHYCDVCKISCASSQTYKEHVEGQKHKKKEALQNGEGMTLSKSRVSFRCETCNVTCTGKDTYESHVLGVKHQKTATLLKKLGKPVAETPTLLAPGERSNKGYSASSAGTPISTVGGPAVPTKKVIGVPSVNIVDVERVLTNNVVTSTEILFDAPEKNSSALEAALAAEKDVQPVGEDYVEEERNACGKLVQYNCRLCDCKFSDPNAKNIHIKGRKHRLQYKLKVNPHLVVDVKPNQVPREMRSALVRKMRTRALTPLMIPRLVGMKLPAIVQHPPTRPWAGIMDMGRRVETADDRHVMAKHELICPDDAYLGAVEKLVNSAETALNAVSDFLAKEVDDTDNSGASFVSSDKTEDSKRDRKLKGVMRVGLLAKGLLIRTDCEVHLVVLCSTPPDKKLLSTVAELFPSYLDIVKDGLVVVKVSIEESALILNDNERSVKCQIVFTSVLLRNEAGETENDVTTNVADVLVRSDGFLPRGPCLDALAESRRANWFQVKCTNLQSASIILRILRDIQQKHVSWNVLSTWVLELLVERVLASCGKPLSPGDALRRIFEAVASGILLRNGPGLIDPCERDKQDVLTYLTDQQREDITSSSQHALRLIGFNQIHKVLCTDRLSDTHVFSASLHNDRKRPRDSSLQEEDD